MRAFVIVFTIAATATAQYNYLSNDEVNNFNEQLVAVQPVVEEYNKAFYSYAAPEEAFEDANAGERIANVLKKNLQVIFIKGPDNTALENAALQLARGSAEDRTAIYVLNKQTDIGELANQVQQLKANNAIKPEVHFVKYRTQADAENAQRILQAQFESIPGSSSNNPNNAANVLDFASKPVETPRVKSVAPSTAPTTPSTRGYIPPRSSFLPHNRRV
ncbi:hypothetical protein DOY81_008160 [Sarcophaga bullata]|nr:hypothetical protein DOY81_008160 [Sarcophaga bullata]